MRRRIAGYVFVGLLAGLLSGCTHAREPHLEDRYLETPGRHSERPGEHSTTVGRHGTSGTVGGGIDAQSGSAGVDDEAVDEQYHEEGGYGWGDQSQPPPPR